MLSNEEIPCSMHQKQMTASVVNGSGYDNSSLICCKTLAEQLALQVAIRAKVLYKFCTQSKTAAKPVFCTWNTRQPSPTVASCNMLLVHTNKLIPHS